MEAMLVSVTTRFTFEVTVTGW